MKGKQSSDHLCMLHSEVKTLSQSFVPHSRPRTEFRDTVEVAPPGPAFSCSYARTATKAMFCLVGVGGGPSRQHLDPECACAGGPKRMRCSVGISWSAYFVLDKISIGLPCRKRCAM